MAAFAFLSLLFACFAAAHAGDTNYLIGVGRFDVTGPAAEVNMMGYAMLGQYAAGIHFRQYSRAFIVADPTTKKRTVFVNADICMGAQSVKLEVIKKLKSIYNGLYTEENVCISATHTHSGSAGYLQYLLFDITSLGFISQTLTAIVDGIVESIHLAHENMQPGNIFFNNGTLLNSNINRSPSAYLFNPDKGLYEHNVDKQMVVLKMVDASGRGIGMISWFAVHGTCMNNTNSLLSGDNKGYASMMMERHMNGNDTLPGRGSFVAAFAQSNEGDVSPNTKGAVCVKTGKPCAYDSSTCNNRTQDCWASGPGKNMFESTQIIGTNQFMKGLELYESAKIMLEGPVDVRQTYVNMTNVEIMVGGKRVHTCPSAMGYSFAAGTTDGPGAFDFIQGDNTSTNPFWNAVRDLLHTPSDAQNKCHYPKPILLDTGEAHKPYSWQAEVVDTQLLRWGQFVIAALPGEFTTMSGRRLRKAVNATLQKNGMPDGTQVVIAGLTNTYADYITTFEEYQDQRYEGASTIYGPYTLDAYIQLYINLAEDMATGKPSPKGPAPQNLVDEQIPYLRPVLYDRAGEGRNFGDVNQDVEKTYKIPSVVNVSFWAGNPRNNLMTNSTYLTVEMEVSGKWVIVSTDSSWDTRFHWKHTSEILGESLATVEWHIDAEAKPGAYRIQHFGYHKPLIGEAEPYSGTSSVFQVTAA
eukprot:m.3678 g.3678  ORF g.3678 m.3678 type:complete len:694 (+) comp9685_c0_seq1:22-2103(+)